MKLLYMSLTFEDAKFIVDGADVTDGLVTGKEADLDAAPSFLRWVHCHTSAHRHNPYPSGSKLE
jgi:hypothetical protein